MTDGEFVFHILYLIITFGLIYPPQEFLSSGFTIENIFSKYLGNEELFFIQYHINRSCLKLLVHSLLPVTYFFIYFLFFDADFDEDMMIGKFWIVLNLGSVLLPFITIFLIYYYKQNKWSNHPICRTLKNYCNSSEQSWHVVAAEINAEVRRNEKLVKQFSSISKIIATENWIMKTSFYFVNFAHQTDAALIANRSDHHNISINDSTDSAQFVNIQVKSTRKGVKNFNIRINSLDFRELQDRINRPIVVLSSVKFHTSLIDRFIDVFLLEAEKNQKYICREDLSNETCFACLIKMPDVKLKKNCVDGTHQENCTNCFCRPMFCQNCIARWFASRQNTSERDYWISSQASCPMCRAKFCILDVCFVDYNN